LCEILFPKSAAFVVTYPDTVSDNVIGRINTQLWNFGVQNEEEYFTLNIITDWSCYCRLQDSGRG
jgi:hypothetical protein